MKEPIAVPPVFSFSYEAAEPSIRVKLLVVRTIRILRNKVRKPKEDPYYPEAVERAKEAVRQLQEAGIIDSEGRRIRNDLPPDMQEDEDRDFGG